MPTPLLPFSAVEMVSANIVNSIQLLIFVPNVLHVRAGKKINTSKSIKITKIYLCKFTYLKIKIYIINNTFTVMTNKY